ncbi:MAG: hypothetical protein R3C12_08735 [Planctomycetaceae bacterium]
MSPRRHEIRDRQQDQRDQEQQESPGFPEAIGDQHGQHADRQGQQHPDHLPLIQTGIVGQSVASRDGGQSRPH